MGSVFYQKHSWGYFDFLSFQYYTMSVEWQLHLSLVLIFILLIERR